MFYANCGLPLNFWNLLLMSFCFIIEKGQFKTKAVTLAIGPF